MNNTMHATLVGWFNPMGGTAGICLPVYRQGPRHFRQVVEDERISHFEAAIFPKVMPPHEARAVSAGSEPMIAFATAGGRLIAGTFKQVETELFVKRNRIFKTSALLEQVLEFVQCRSMAEWEVLRGEFPKGPFAFKPWFAASDHRPARCVFVGIGDIGHATIPRIAANAGAKWHSLRLDSLRTHDEIVDYPRAASRAQAEISARFHETLQFLRSQTLVFLCVDLGTLDGLFIAPRLAAAARAAGVRVVTCVVGSLTHARRHEFYADALEQLAVESHKIIFHDEDFLRATTTFGEDILGVRALRPFQDIVDSLIAPTPAFCSSGDATAVLAEKGWAKAGYLEWHGGINPKMLVDQMAMTIRAGAQNATTLWFSARVSLGSDATELALLIDESVRLQSSIRVSNWHIGPNERDESSGRNALSSLGWIATGYEGEQTAREHLGLRSPNTAPRKKLRQAEPV